MIDDVYFLKFPAFPETHINSCVKCSWFVLISNRNKITQADLSVKIILKRSLRMGKLEKIKRFLFLLEGYIFSSR